MGHPRIAAPALCQYDMLAQSRIKQAPLNKQVRRSCLNTDHTDDKDHLDTVVQTIQLRGYVYYPRNI